MESQKSSSPPRRLEELTIDTGRDILKLEGFFDVKLEKDYVIINKVDEKGNVFATLGYLRPLKFSVGYINK